MRQIKVLLIAEAANPEWVSVPLVGWSHAKALRSLFDVHLVTQVRNRDAIRAAGLEEGRDFTAIDSELVARPLHKLSNLIRRGAGVGFTTGTALQFPSYCYFEHLVWKAFSTRIREKEFDIVHRITPLSPTLPSLIAKKCAKAAVPFVWGPINGGAPWPKEFDAVRRKEREWLSYVRGAYKLLPGYRSTRRYASAILVGSQDTLEQMPQNYHEKCVYLPENAIWPECFSRQVEPPTDTPIRVAFVGRLVPYKGADMLIEAAAQLIKDGKITLDVMGDGPEMPRLREMVTRLDVANGVRLRGWIQHEELQTHLVQCHVFGFPSVREFGGGVVLEAMALGLVPIVVDYAGPRELVTSDVGYKVPMGKREEIIKGFREVLQTVCRRSAQIGEMGQRARNRVMALFTWERKAAQVGHVYEWVLRIRADKPNFAFDQVPQGPR